MNTLEKILAEIDKRIASYAAELDAAKRDPRPGQQEFILCTGVAIATLIELKRWVVNGD